ncbi:hypothetical protein J1605_007035 [Eschrichtius robustus]|uniref:Dynein light chain n=1 Tax=Eschrichtius robustus TaxID=9764 RepID=A0AB34H123_ESCRO|nr:hypothetical protein J1605_007035 [Eschrichtius robustus]
MCDQKAVIKNANMSEEMQQDLLECATQALEKYNIEKHIAAHIKKEFDKKLKHKEGLNFLKHRLVEALWAEQELELQLQHEQEPEPAPDPALEPVARAIISASGVAAAWELLRIETPRSASS